MTESATHSAKPVDVAGVVTRPPNILAGAFLLGLALELLFPTCLPGGRAHLVLGLPFLAAGLWLMPTAIRTFRAAGTPIETHRPSERIVTHGVYAYSRNPIYVSMVLLLVGLGIEINSVWVLALVVPFVLVLRFGVIGREERYLERKFGAEYLAYKRRVRRWI